MRERLGVLITILRLRTIFLHLYLLFSLIDWFICAIGAQRVAKGKRMQTKRKLVHCSIRIRCLSVGLWYQYTTVSLLLTTALNFFFIQIYWLAITFDLCSFIEKQGTPFGIVYSSNCGVQKYSTKLMYLLCSRIINYVRAFNLAQSVCSSWGAIKMLNTGKYEYW